CSHAAGGRFLNGVKKAAGAAAEWRKAWFLRQQKCAQIKINKTKYVTINKYKIMEKMKHGKTDCLWQPIWNNQKIRRKIF
ncbi:MAG: hypothetical protein IAA16_00005, partial [Candidatus Treponema excrementipullorum]|nr:hypothetical protein [Candidatus Treponema excrementipullorum]